MPKVSVRMDDDIYEKLKVKAKELESSISEIIRHRLSEYLNGWPQGFFDLFGSLKDCPIEVPEDRPWIPGEGETYDDGPFKGHANKCFGSITDDSFQVPGEMPWELDAPRILFDDPDEKDGSKDKKRKTRD